MKIFTTANETVDTAHAVAEMVDALKQRLSEPPVILKTSYTEQHDPKIILETLRIAFPDTQILGGSTHEGLFTEKRTYGFGKPAIGVLAICDEFADVGVAVEALPPDAGKQDILTALQTALARAQDQADRRGELPDLIWTYMTPGLEEDSIAALVDTFGEGTRTVGMTVADNFMTAKWSMFDERGVTGNGIGIALFYSTEAVTHYIQSGFMPKGPSGVVTKAEGRNLITIDDKPASEVFVDWLGHDCITETGQVSYELMGLSSLAHRVGETRLPSGTVIEDYYLVAPVLSDGQTLTMVANPVVGEKIYMMTGEKESMHNRLGNVTQQTLDKSSELGPMAGGILVMCAGYTMAMQHDSLKSMESLIETFDGIPVLGTMGYGEQGTYTNGKCIHGNWMVSSTVFSA
ncbi:MAG: FIST N-terminal domain-containing protein [Pseudomonadota bacterium]